MRIEEYQERARTTRRPKTNEHRVVYPVLGLNGEAGEVAESIKKSMRKGTVWDTEALLYELGDVLWYISATADDLGLSLDDIAEKNLEKLAKRDARRVSVESLS